jgi:hypothetical protein
MAWRWRHRIAVCSAASRVTKNRWAEDVTRGKSVYGKLNRCGVSPGRRIKKSISVDRETIMCLYSVAENSCGIVRRRNALVEEEDMR